jgi:hypothetical protein
MVKTAEEITGNPSQAKKVIIAATERFWALKYTTWKFRCDIVIQWEKDQAITKKMKRTKTKQTIEEKVKNNKRKNTTNNPTYNESKYITETFKTLFIELTNLAMTNIIHNGHFFYNFFIISISASGVLTR